MFLVMENTMDNQNDSEYTLQDLVAQGACYPLAMKVWQQLLPRQPARKSPSLPGAMKRTTHVLEDRECEDGAE